MTAAPEILPDTPPPPRAQWRKFARRLAWQIANFFAIAAVVIAALHYGLQLRQWAWQETSDVHFENSLNNAVFWGNQANKEGIANVYPKLVEDSNEGEDLIKDPGGGPLALDYPPLRLMIAAKWAAWGEDWYRAKDEKRLLDDHQRRHQPAVLTKLDQARLDQWSAARVVNRGPWRNDEDFNRPMLELNTACELAGAIAMFLLVHLWLRRCAGAPARQWVQPLRCAWPALFAALLLWFSPAVIFNAHCYEQWDCYTLAPFLFAMYFGMLDLWLISGLVIGTVAMAKGQILIILPAIVIWQLLMFHPILAMRQLRRMIFDTGQRYAAARELAGLIAAPFGVVFRLAAGVFLAVGIVTSPWMVNNSLASTWVLSVGIGLALLLPLFFLRGRSPMYLLASGVCVILAAAFILWPWSNSSAEAPPGLSVALVGLIAVAVAARLLPRSWIISWAALPMAAAIFACYPVFKTDMDWYLVGIKFPAEHWKFMYWCHPFNLGALLQDRFGWGYWSTLNLSDYFSFISKDPTKHPNINWLIERFEATPRPGEHPPLFPIIPMRFLMMAAYLLTMSISAIGMAIQYRRRNRNFLFAMVAPWLLMFALLPQMQNRYLIWAAAFTAATASFSFDGLLLFLLLNALSVTNTLWDMCHWMMNKRNSPTIQYWMPVTSRDMSGRPTSFGGIGPLFPDLAWMVLLLAAIYLYLSLRRNRRSIPIDWPALAARAGKSIASATEKLRSRIPSKSTSRSETDVPDPIPA